MIALLGAGQSTAWDAFIQSYAGISAYSATITTFERDGARVQNSVLTYTFRKPASATVNVLVGKNAGVTIVWDGGNQVVAHRGHGLLALFKKSFALRDPAVMSIRGDSVDEISFSAFITHLEGTPGIVSEEPGPSILGIATVAVTLIPTSPSADAGLTREVIDLSVPTHLPLRLYGYVGDTMFREIDFSNVQVKG